VYNLLGDPPPDPATTQEEPANMTLLDQYAELCGHFVPGDHDISTLDQNIGTIHTMAAEVGLDLRDPDTLDTVVKAHIVSIAFAIAHIEATCDSPPCLTSATAHVQAANGQLGNHFAEIRKHL
jgi:hypothetical protein